MRLIDISPPLSSDTAVWPGDVPLERTIACAMADGDNLDLSSIRTTVHIGAHTDAPSHYQAGAADIASRDLALYYGPVEVMTVSVPPGARIGTADLPRPPTEPRLLLRTGSFPDPTQFNTDFASLSPELVHELAARGVLLIGIDTPSIDPFDDAELRSHNAIASHDMAILEGIVLTHVEDGTYLLSAFPLALVGADASPVRAVLIDDRP